ncbi:hypothetical protein HanPSC8_Chr05g0228211 [Helianthus annuus]|nr:hypothetical protein HanPSC8_Chr05g0228211 [Helianthus annuus]
MSTIDPLFLQQLRLLQPILTKPLLSILYVIKLNMSNITLFKRSIKEVIKSSKPYFKH